MLVGSYFCTHVSRLLDFDMNDVVSFDTKYFLFLETYLLKTISTHKKNYTKNNNKCRHLPIINN